MPNNIKSKKTKIFTISTVIIILLLLVFGAGFVAGKVTDGKINFKLNPLMYQETALSDIFKNSLTEQVWSLIKNKYVDRAGIDEQKLFYGALKGLVGGLGDPYSIFMDPELAMSFQTQINGEFEGIGAEIAIKDNILTVVAPLAGTPAEKAGLMSGDRIFAIDGKETNGLTAEQAAKLIRGNKGTIVTLLVLRGAEDPQEIKIARDVIKLKSVDWKSRSDGILHIKLTSFNADSMQVFSQIVKSVAKNKPLGIILDMRNNPGGLLDTAVDVCSLWLENQTVVVEKFGDGREIKYIAGNSAPFKNIPTIVLINEGSASGSEIVAGAFKDYGIAKLVGKKSFGKGSVQELKDLPDGSSLKITVAKWLTPLGQAINGTGVAPDMEVDFTKDDFQNKQDPQLDKAVEMLLKNGKI